MRPVLALAFVLAALSGATAEEPALCRDPAPQDARAAAERVAMCNLATPVATTKWTCPAPLGPMTAVFYDTDPGTVRLGYGGSVEVGVQTLSASGARYETSSGLVFWTKGSTTAVTRPGAADAECTLG